MIINVNTLEAQEMGGGMSVTFPFSSATGMADSAAVYIVLEPGGVLPEHTDSAEEWLLVLEGTVEATVGDQTVTLTEGDLAWSPRSRPTPR
jgi:quercetin dioxygenase-like cupin family protein